MKWIFIILVLAGALIVVFGSPLAGDPPRHDYYFNAPEPILPMSFAHANHTSVNCVDCHHNFVDGSGSGFCMNCHVSDTQLWPRFRHDFHALCRDCHMQKAKDALAGGPPRACMGCHAGDTLP